jgi:FkbM family methyltransferase
MFTRIARPIKKAIRKAFDALGWVILPKRKVAFGGRDALERSVKRGLSIKTVIDVGASDGRWTQMAKPFFPNAHYHLIEAQEPHLPHLAAFAEQDEKITFVHAAAGAKSGTLYFDTGNLFGGLASTQPFKDNNQEVRSVTIDEEVAIHQLQPPFLIKLDTNGYELPILEGAKETLKNTEYLVVEVYNFHVSDGSLLFYDFCKHMEELGFRPIEAVDFLSRQLDGSFWQMDLHFMRKENEVFVSDEFD